MNCGAGFYSTKEKLNQLSIHHEGHGHYRGCFVSVNTLLRKSDTGAAREADPPKKARPRGTA